MAGSKDTGVAMPPYARFIIGGMSGCGATFVTHPLDLTKTRMQLIEAGSQTRRSNTLHTLKTVARVEGFTAVYAGLSAALLRQLLYTSGRMGFFSFFLDMGRKADGKPPGIAWKSFSGIASGMLGALMGNPADLEGVLVARQVALIRMAADGRLPPSERRGYRHAVDALVRIVREEGVAAAYTGALPTMARAMVVNLSQVVTYAHLKEKLLANGLFRDDFKCHFVVSMISGVVTAVSTMPLDMAKTRLQNMKTTEGPAQYKGMLDVWTKVVRHEGVLSLWKGITPSYLRIGPHTVIFFLLLENITRLYKVHVLKDTTSGGF